MGCAMSALATLGAKIEWLRGIEREYRDITRINGRYSEIGPAIAKADGIALALKELEPCFIVIRALEAHHGEG
jgi:hypothetical protein